MHPCGRVLENAARYLGDLTARLTTDMLVVALTDLVMGFTVA